MKLGRDMGHASGAARLISYLHRPLILQRRPSNEREALPSGGRL
jgi:hypothetical protein